MRLIFEIRVARGAPHEAQEILGRGEKGKPGGDHAAEHAGRRFLIGPQAVDGDEAAAEDVIAPVDEGDWLIGDGKIADGKAGDEGHARGEDEIGLQQISGDAAGDGSGRRDAGEDEVGESRKSTLIFYFVEDEGQVVRYEALTGDRAKGSVGARGIEVEAGEALRRGCGHAAGRQEQPYCWLGEDTTDTADDARARERDVE